MRARIGDRVKVEINGKTFEFEVVGCGDDTLVLQAPRGSRWSLKLIPQEDDKPLEIQFYQVDAESRRRLDEDYADIPDIQFGV